MFTCVYVFKVSYKCLFQCDFDDYTLFYDAGCELLHLAPKEDNLIALSRFFKMLFMFLSDL